MDAERPVLTHRGAMTSCSIVSSFCVSGFINVDDEKVKTDVA